MTTKEQIRNDQGPSLKLPLRPNPLETAGRTCTVEMYWTTLRCTSEINILEFIQNYFHSCVIDCIECSGFPSHVQTYQYHGRGSGNCKHGTDQYHFSVPCCGPAFRHGFRSQERLPKLGKGRHWLLRYRLFECFCGRVGVALSRLCATSGQKAPGSVLFYWFYRVKHSWRCWKMGATASLQRTIVRLDQSLSRKRRRRHTWSTSNPHCKVPYRWHHLWIEQMVIELGRILFLSFTVCSAICWIYLV